MGKHSVIIMDQVSCYQAIKPAKPDRANIKLVATE